MIELLPEIGAWQREGLRVALATLVEVRGSAPRDPGAVFAIAADGRVAGSVSGGCVEAALAHEAAAVLVDGRARIAAYGLTDVDARAVGLTCGGHLRVLVELVDAQVVQRLERAAAPNALAATAIRLNGERIGSRLCIFSQDHFGTLGDEALDAAIMTQARGSGTAAGIRLFGERGEPHGEVEVFIEREQEPAQMYVFGAVDFAQAMVAVGKMLGYRVTVCDARTAFARRERFPQADEIVASWPDEFLQHAPIDERTAIVALTHDEKFDIPLLLAALRSRAGYVGAMGSRATHARRLALLREAGLREEEIARLRAPIGLDIGARTPQETAISIAAELIAFSRGRSGEPLTGGSGSLRG